MQRNFFFFFCFWLIEVVSNLLIMKIPFQQKKSVCNINKILIQKNTDSIVNNFYFCKFYNTIVRSYLVFGLKTKSYIWKRYFQIFTVFCAVKNAWNWNWKIVYILWGTNVILIFQKVQFLRPLIFIVWSWIRRTRWNLDGSYH